MTGRTPTASARALALGLVLGLGAVACAHTDVPESLPGPTTTSPPTTAAPEPAPAGCSENPSDPNAVVKSVPASDAVTGYVSDIKRRGFLRVGVDTSTLLWSFVDPASGDFVGFDVDIAREVTKALFPAYDPENREATELRLVAIPYSERVQILQEAGADGVPKVDMVIDTFTINCRRDADIDFSVQYFDAQQRVLVPKDSPAKSIGDLNGSAGDIVCAPWGSTSIANLADPAKVGDDPPEIRGADEHAECLVLLQQGKVTAISGDDTVLAGMVDQDPNLHLVGDGFSSEPYGIGLPPDHPEWVAYVNAVLDDLRTTGRWVELYNKKLLAALGEPGTPPTPQYD
jgi:polar amino acid transport system substrate-binding protein